MIFLTVGTQLPFDRLVRALDSWSESHQQADVFGQIADPGPDGYLPRYFEWRGFIEPDEFQRKCTEADVIVSHAGMGAIITALTLVKPLIIMPRKASLNEHRNEHQLGTAEKFTAWQGIHVAEDDTRLGPLLDELLANKSNTGASLVSPFADPDLIASVRDFIFQDRNR